MARKESDDEREQLLSSVAAAHVLVVWCRCSSPHARAVMDYIAAVVLSVVAKRCRVEVKCELEVSDREVGC
jgi:hypothetical protein